MRHGCIQIGSLLVFFVLVYAFLDKVFFERCKIQGLIDFVQFDLKLAQQNLSRMVYTVAQHVADAEEPWVTILDNATVGRDTDFAKAESI